MTREGAFDPGVAPPEPVQETVPLPVVKEDLRTRALRKIQEDETFEKQAKEALEVFGAMLRKVTGLGGYGWYVELAGDDVERDPGDEA